MKSPQYPEHFSLSHLPTPLKRLDNFSKLIHPYSITVKRDDLSGIELSGNKIRKLDFLLKDAIMQGAKRIITCGGLQSNHCRTTAYAAIQCGLKVTLVLRGQENKPITGNYLLSKMSGAEIILVNEETYKNVDTLMEEYAAKGTEKVYVIPEGGSNETGAWGYVKCFFELQEQILDNNIDCDTIAVASGSGGTHAGLLIGKLLARSPLNVVSVNVCDDAEYFVNKIDGILDRFEKRYKQGLTWKRSDINVIDGFVGGGYGKISGPEEKTILTLLKYEGIILEPVYTAKAFGGIQQLMSKAVFPGKNIIFIHTGGIFGVFPYWQEMLNENRD